jgi:hypothetical protein
MARRDRTSTVHRHTYRHQTLKPLHCLVFVLPMLLAFHITTAVTGTNLLALRDIHKVLRYFGATLPWLPGLVVLVVLLTQQVLWIGGWRISGRVLAGMLVESVAWVLPLVALGHLTGSLWAHQATRGAAGGPDLAEILPRVITAMGAGVYEEFVFRMIAMGLIVLIFADWLELSRKAVTAVAVVLSSLAFSLYHFPPDAIANFSFSGYEFTFRAMAGAYLAAAFTLRGFGVAVGAHVAYNIYVTVYLM